METHLLFARLISSLMSLLDSANLRNRVYAQQQRIDTLELAIEDIARINSSSAPASERHKLIVGIVNNCSSTVDNSSDSSDSSDSSNP